MARRVITAREQHELAEPFLRLAAPDEPLAEWEKDLMASAEAEPVESVQPPGVTGDIIKKYYPEHSDDTIAAMAEDWSHSGDLAAQQQRAHEHLTKLTTPGHSFYSPEPGSHADKWKAIHEDAFGEPWTGEVEKSDKAKSLAQDAADAFAPAGFKVKTQDEFFNDHAPPGTGPQPKAAEPSATDSWAALNTFLESANDENFFGGDNNDEWATEAAAVNSPEFAQWFAQKYPDSNGETDSDGKVLYPDVVAQEYLKEKGQGSTSSDDDYDQIQELLKPVGTPPPAATPDLSGMDENLQNFFLTDADEGSQYSALADNDHFKDWFNENYPDFDHGDMFTGDVVFEYESPWNEHDYYSQPVWMQNMSYGNDADGELTDWQREVGPEQIHEWKDEYDDGGLQAIQSFHEYLDNQGIDHPDDLDVAMYHHTTMDTTEEEYDYWKDQLPYGAEEYFAENPTEGNYDYQEWKDYYNGETLHHKSSYPGGPNRVNYDQMYSDQGYDVPEDLSDGYDSFVPGFKAYMLTQYPSLEQHDINNFGRGDWSELEQGWDNLSQSDKNALGKFEYSDLHPEQQNEKFKPTPAAQASTPTPVPSGPVVPFATPFPANQHGMPTTLEGYQALANTVWGSSVGQDLKDQWIETQMAGGGGAATTHKYLKDNYPQQWQNWQTQQSGAQAHSSPSTVGEKEISLQDWNAVLPGHSQWFHEYLGGHDPDVQKEVLQSAAAGNHGDQIKAAAEKLLSGSGAQPAAAPQGTSQITPQMVIDHLVNQPGSGWKWNPENHNQSSIALQGLSGKSSEELKNQLKTWAADTYSDSSSIPAQKTLDALFGSQPQETPSSTFHKQLVTSPEFKAWFKKDNSFDLDEDDKDGSLKEMLLDPTNDWTMSKLIQFKNAQPKSTSSGTFTPDSFTADYKKAFPGTTYTFNSPMGAKNILEGIIDEDEYEGVGYFDGDDYETLEEAYDEAQYPTIEEYQDAVDEWQKGKDKAQDLLDKYFGDNEVLDDQGASKNDFGQDEAANKFGQLLNDNKFYDWVTGKTGEVNSMAQAFYPKYPQYALDAWEAKQGQGGASAPISSYTPKDIAQAAADFGWHTTAENWSGQTLEGIKENLDEIVGNQASSGPLKANAQKLLDKFFGGGAPASPAPWKPPAEMEVHHSLLDHDGSLAPGVLQWMNNKYKGGGDKQENPAKWLGWISGDDGTGYGWGPGDWEIVAKDWGYADRDHWVKQPMPEGLAAALGQSPSSPAAAPAFDALQVATEYGKILGLSSDVHGGGKAYKDMSYDEFKNKLKSNIQKAQDGSFYPEKLTKFQALYDKYFGQPQSAAPVAATPQGPVNFGDTSPLKIPVDPFGTPDSLMSGDDLNPDFEKWLWDKRDKNMSPETFLAAIKSWTPEHWKAVEDAFLGTGQPAAAVSADPEVLKDKLTDLWQEHNDNGDYHHVPAGGSYKQWMNNLSPEALQHFLDNPDAGHKDFGKFLNSSSFGDPYKPPVFPSASPGKGAAPFDAMTFAQDAAAAFGGDPDLANDGGKKFKDMTYDEAKESIAQGAGGEWGGDKAKWQAVYDKYFGGGAPAGKTVAPVPFKGGVEWAKEYMKATNWTGSYPEDITTKNIKFVDMTPEQAKAELEGDLESGYGGDEAKPKLQALYDKYFGEGAAAGPAPLVSADPEDNKDLVVKENYAATGYGFSTSLYNSLREKPGMLQSWMNLSPAEKGVITKNLDNQYAWITEHKNDAYQSENSAAAPSGSHDYNKIGQLAQKMSYGGGGKYITNTADWMTWVHGLDSAQLTHALNFPSDASEAFDSFLKDEDDDDPYYALKKWYEDNHGTTDGFYELAKKPKEFGKFYDKWKQETSGGDLGTFTEEPEAPSSHIPSWVTTSEVGKKFFPNGPQEYPGFKEYFKAMQASNSKMSVSTALNQWHKKPQHAKDEWIKQAGGDNQTPAPAPTFANPFAELIKKPSFYDQFQAIVNHDPAKVEKNKNTIAEKGVDWVKDQIKKRLKVETDPEKFVKLVDLWQKNFGGPTGSGAVTPLLKKHKPGQPLDQATLVKLWQLKDTGELPDWIKNAPADTSGDIWPTYEEQDDPLGSGAAPAAPGPIKYDSDSFAKDVIAAEPTEKHHWWAYGFAENAKNNLKDHIDIVEQKIIDGELPTMDGTKTLGDLQKVYNKWFGDGAASGTTNPEIPDNLGAAAAWATEGGLSPQWFDSGEQTQQEKKNMLLKHINVTDYFNEEQKAKLQQVHDKFFGDGAAQSSGGMTLDEMKAKIKAADPSYWSNSDHDYKFNKWSQEEWLPTLKSMVENSKSSPSAFKPGEVDTYKEIINQLEGGGPASSSPASAAAVSAKGFDEDFILKKLQEADPEYWHEDRLEELKDNNWGIDKWKKYVQKWQDNGNNSGYSDAEMKCYEDILDHLDDPSAAVGSSSGSSAGGGAPAQQYPPGISSWSGSGSSAPPSMNEIVKGQISTLMDKLRAPESEGIYNEDDISTARSPEFQQWFRDAPAPYRQTTSQFPYMALEDYAKGGEYGWVPETTGDIARVYDPYSYPAKGSGKGGWITTPQGERLRLPGYGDKHWPGTTFNPESTSDARPKTKFPNRPPDVPGQLEIPLPDGSSWVPDKKFPELRRGISVEFNRYEPGNNDHHLLRKPGIVGERHREAARLMQEIKELMIGPQPGRKDSSEEKFKEQTESGVGFDPPWTLFDAETGGAEFVDAPPKPSKHDPDSWLEWLAFAQKNNVPPEQMWDLAKQVGSQNPDKYGTPPQSYLIAQSHRDPAPMAKEISRLTGEEFTASDLFEVSKKLKRIRDNNDRDGDYDQKTRNRADDLYEKWFGQGFVDDLLAHKILEYVETGAWKTPDYRDHPNVGGIGSHWTTKDSTDFGSGRSADEGGFPLEVIIDWPGAGEDPDRKDAAWNYESEKEISLNPGTPVIVKRIRFKHPRHGDSSGSYDRNTWITYDFTPHKRHAAIAPRRQGRAIVSHRERYAADDDPGADFDVWPDPYQNRAINYGQPTSLKTPRYDEHTRPRHDNGEYHFSPDEINPPSDSSSRPDIKWIGHEPEQDVLPDIDFPDEAAPGVPIDRHAQPLFRGLSLDLTHPDAAEIHRMVYGHHPDDHHLFDLDHEPQARYDHPELARAILDHLENARQPTHGLGRHWSLDPSEAHGFAISEALSLLNDPDSIQLPVRLRADWKGAGENPYRHETGETGGEFSSEQEMNMLPGANMDIGDVQIRHPDLHRWVSLDHQRQHRHAQHTTVRPRSAKRILTHREMMEG